MSSRHLVDPELLPFVDAMPTLDIDGGKLPAIRLARKAMLAQLPPFPETVAVEERHIPGPAGAPAIRVKLYQRRSGAALRCGREIRRMTRVRA